MQLEKFPLPFDPGILTSEVNAGVEAPRAQLAAERGVQGEGTVGAVLDAEHEVFVRGICSMWPPQQLEYLQCA